MSDVRRNQLKSSQIIFRFSKNPGLRVASGGDVIDICRSSLQALGSAGAKLFKALQLRHQVLGKNPLGKSMGNERFSHKKVKKNWNIAHERWKTRLYETNSRSWEVHWKREQLKLTIWSGRKIELKRQQKELTQKKWEFQYRKPGEPTRFHEKQWRNCRKTWKTKELGDSTNRTVLNWANYEQNNPPKPGMVQLFTLPFPNHLSSSSTFLSPVKRLPWARAAPVSLRAELLAPTHRSEARLRC